MKSSWATGEMRREERLRKQVGKASRVVHKPDVAHSSRVRREFWTVDPVRDRGGSLERKGCRGLERKGGGGQM